MGMRWKVMQTACLFLLLPILASCMNKPVKIGLMVDLTGRASEIGISARNGAEIAVGEINESGGIRGRKINLIVKDDKGLPKEAEKVDKELIEEGVLLGIGHIASGTGTAGYKVFENAGTLMISPTMSTESFSGKRDHFIRVIDSNRKQGELLAEVAARQGGNKRIAMLYEKNNIPYTEEVCRYFRQAFTASGGSIVLGIPFSSSPDMDFDDITGAILETDADGTLIVAGGLDLALLTQKIKQKKPDMKMYTGMWAMTADLIKNGGKAVEGIYLPGVYDARNPSPDFTAFRKKYLETFREEPTFASVYSYESVYMVRDSLLACRKYDTGSIRESIGKIGKFHGLQNDFTIDGFGDTKRGYYLFRVDHGEFVRVRE